MASLSARVEGLGHRDERDAVRVEELDQLGEVGERSGEAIHLVDDDHVDAAATGSRRAAAAAPVAPSISVVEDLDDVTHCSV